MIEIRRVNVRITVGTYCVGTLIIGEKEDDVWSFARFTGKNTWRSQSEARCCYDEGANERATFHDLIQRELFTLT